LHLLTRGFTRFFSQSMNLQTYQNKKVVIMGLGLHGGGLAAAKWFFKHGARVIVTDMKNAHDLRISIEKLSDFCDTYTSIHPRQNVNPIEYVLGEHRLEDVKTADLIIQNPGVPRESEYLVAARQADVKIENEVSLFFLLTPHVKKIGITGTKGKSTTTMFIYEILKRVYADTHLVGVATPEGSVGFFEILDEVIEHQEKGMSAPVIMELSSWQLELLDQHTSSPDIAVITNVMRDHLNRYATMEHYADAKKNIYQYQTSSDSIVLNYDNQRTREMGLAGVPGQLYWFSAENQSPSRGVFLKREDTRSSICFSTGQDVDTVCRTDVLRIPGVHVLQDALAAVTVAKILHIPDETICAALSAFKGVRSRLEYITEIEGRTFYNDTTATTPDACIAALQTLDKGNKKRIILIAGGGDKHLEFKEVGQVVTQHVSALILLAGTATPLFATSVAEAGFTKVMDMANSMQEAVMKAWKHSKKNDSIVLSPACTSFGMFTNEFDRGEQFIREIERLRDSNNTSRT